MPYDVEQRCLAAPDCQALVVHGTDFCRAHQPATLLARVEQLARALQILFDQVGGSESPCQLDRGYCQAHLVHATGKPCFVAEARAALRDEPQDEKP